MTSTELVQQIYEALCCQLIRDLAAARDALEAWTEYFTENEQPTAKSFCMKEYKSARDAYSNACTAMAQPEPEGPTDEELLASVRHFYGDQTAADMGAEDDLRTARAVLAKWGHQ